MKNPNITNLKKHHVSQIEKEKALQKQRFLVRLNESCARRRGLAPFYLASQPPSTLSTWPFI